MKPGDLVYYRLTEVDANKVNKLCGWSGEYFFIDNVYREVSVGEVLPALVLKAYSTFERVSPDDIADAHWAKGSFSGVADIKVFLPGIIDLWLPEVELDENPTAASQQYSNSLHVIPAMGKFTTVEPPPLI